MMSVKRLVATLVAASAVVTGCTSGGGASDGGTSAANGESGTPTGTPTASLPTTGDTGSSPATPCMSLLREIPPGTLLGGSRRSAPVVLTAIARRFGPTVTYDFESDGPVTATRSFEHRSVYAIVLGKHSHVDVSRVEKAIEFIPLGVSVVVLRSCVGLPRLVHIRRQLHFLANSLPGATMGTSISTARGQVMVTVHPRKVARIVRERYGERVHVQVGLIRAL